MKNFYDFRVWCENAVSGIRFAPDRKVVYGELLDHLYDHYDDLVSQGVDEARFGHTDLTPLIKQPHIFVGLGIL